MIRAIAWDNDPEQHFDKLVPALNRIGIPCEFEPEWDRFILRVTDEPWDCVITDLVNEGSPKGEDDRSGEEVVWAISRLDDPARRSTPVFILTNFTHYLDPSRYGRNVAVKSKALSPAWMAGEIKQTLIERGVFHDPTKVFLAWGHGEDANTAVRNFFVDHGVRLEVIDAAMPLPGIVQGLVDSMKGAAAVVAICTPDDELKRDKGVFHPRPNVLLEIGLAVGITRSTRRLIVLQDERVTMPSDLGGDITIRFAGSVESKFPLLEERLLRLGVALRPPKGA
jgi:predicted nucleotide-binding protein